MVQCDKYSMWYISPTIHTSEFYDGNEDVYWECKFVKLHV